MRFAALLRLAFPALLALVFIAAPRAEQRTALVIGNAQYASAPLANPIRDAKEVAAALREAGFDVILRANADKATLGTALDEFRQVLSAKQGVALFYFAGHGVQIDGENYLIPIDQRFRSEADIKKGSLRAADVTEAMNRARTSLNIVVLDACRDNGFGATQVRGLSRMDTGARLFVSFSTSPGSVALDGADGNSPFTKYLAEAIKTPDIPLEEAFKRTLKGVYQETSGQQTPWISSSFFGDFFFRWTGKASETSSTERAAFHFPSPQSPGRGGETAVPTLSGVYHVTGTNPNGSPYRGMVAIAQAGDQVNVTWWIGKQVYNGTGHFAGRMLVVNWGAEHPVIYSFNAPNQMEGEWADGSAKETLKLFALASSRPSRSIEGRYRASGKVPQGADYWGMVDISKEAERFRINWTIGNDRYQGEGVLDGNLLTVNWGSETPVVYAVMENGTLQGLWNAGAGQETLTPQ